MALYDQIQVFDILHEVVNHVPSKYYCDMLYESIATNAFRKSASGENITVPHSRGFVFRIYDGEKFIEVADSDAAAIKDRVSKIISRIELKPKNALPVYPKHERDIQQPMKKDISTIPLETKINQVREIWEYIKNVDKRVINPVVSYQDELTKRLFVNSEGSKLRRVIPRTRIFIQPIVKVDGKADFDYLIKSGEMGCEIFDECTPDILDLLVKSSINLVQAPLPPSGLMPVVLDPSMAGLIAHESFGHGLEADQIVRGRSYAAPYFQKQIASPIVNISDSPIMQGAIGSYPFDDEGIVAQKTPLVENGIFTHLLHTRVTASILGAEPRGNGRRQSFLHPVYPRMSNTFFEPGDHQFDELIRGVKQGLLLNTSFFGMEDPLGGGIQINSRKGHLIQNGEIGPLVKGINLSGLVLELLQEIDAVSKGQVLLDGGMCGKGIEDLVPVTSGGVYIRVKKALVGPG